MKPMSTPTEPLLTTRKSIGARELKIRLGTYLRLVQEGATLIITERGRPVAELRPIQPEAHGLEQQLDRLRALGVISGTIGERRPLAYFDPIVSAGPPVSQTLLQEREDRF